MTLNLTILETVVAAAVAKAAGQASWVRAIEKKAGVQYWTDRVFVNCYICFGPTTIEQRAGDNKHRWLIVVTGGQQSTAIFICVCRYSLTVAVEYRAR